MSNKIETYISERIVSMMNEIDSLEEQMLNLNGKINMSMKLISEEKAKSKTAADLKEVVLGFQKDRYQLQLLSQHGRDVAFRLRELLLVAEAFQIPYNLTDEQIEGKNLILEKGKPLFTVEKGEVVPTDNELFDQVLKAMNMSVDDSIINSIYEKIQ